MRGGISLLRLFGIALVAALMLLGRILCIPGNIIQDFGGWLFRKIAPEPR